MAYTWNTVAVFFLSPSRRVTHRASHHYLLLYISITVFLSWASNAVVVMGISYFIGVHFLVVATFLHCGLVTGNTEPEDESAPEPEMSTSGNGNSSMMVVTEAAAVSEDAPLWIRVFDGVQLACIIVGLLANVLTLVTLARSGKDFSRPVLLLFRHQSVADLLVCLLAGIVMLQPFMWLTGIYVLDVVVCYAWHGQALYWGSVTLSTYNLVLIACERYMAVCRPFDYAAISDISGKKVSLYLFLLYLLCIAITHGCYIQTRLSEGHCTAEYAFDGMDAYFKVFVIFTYVMTYLAPAVIMAALYGLVALSLRARGKDTKLAHSKVIDKASQELTKTAFAVTIIFIITIGYDLHYYLLGYIGVLDYILNSPIQKIGVFLSNLNSCLNPFVYAALMPTYRASVRKTFDCARVTSGRATSSAS